MHLIFFNSDVEDSDSETEWRHLEQLAAEESDEAMFYDELVREDTHDHATFQSFQDQCVMLQGVRCAAHTLQLVVLKAIGSDKYSTIISRARNIAKKLKTQNLAAMLRRLNLKKPILDCPTRYLIYILPLTNMSQNLHFEIDGIVHLTCSFESQS